MSATHVDWLVTAAGALHFLQLPTMGLARRALAKEGKFDHFDAFTRTTLALFGAGIVSCVAGLGLVALASHGLLLHERTGRALCAFLAIFWTLRGIAQWTILRSSWPRSLRGMHAMLCVLYPLLGGLYGAALLLRPG